MAGNGRYAVPGDEKSVRRRVLAATVLGSGLVFLDASILTVALPAIQRSFGISTATQQWVVSGYLLALSTLLLVGGRLADMWGRKRMFLFGLWAYAVLAASAGLAPSPGVLIALRTLQGVAGALLVPTALAIISAVFPPDERGRAIGVWAAWSGITTIAGPLLGGMAIDYVSWRFAFLITPPVALAAIAVSRGIPESRDPEASRHLDWVGLGLIVGSLGGIVFAMIQGPNSGWSSPLIVGSMVTGVLLLPCFVWWEGRSASPLMPYRMFANRNLAVANVVTFFVYAGLQGSFFFIPLYIQTALGVSATAASATMMPVTAFLFAMSPLVGRLNDRYGPRWLMTFGPLTSAVGLVLVGLTQHGRLWTVLGPGMVVFGIGLGLTVVPVTATAIGSADERYSGVASGFNNGVSRIAGLLAIAVMGIVILQLWHAALASTTSSAAPRVAAALERSYDKAFVPPPGDGLSPAEKRTATRLADAAAARAFLNGMLVAAGLVAAGGIVSAVWIRSPDRPSRQESAATAS